MTEPIRTNGVSFTYTGMRLPDCMEDRPEYSEPTLWCLEQVGPWNVDWTRHIETIVDIMSNNLTTTRITYYFKNASAAVLFKLTMHELQYDTTVTLPW